MLPALSPHSIASMHNLIHPAVWRVRRMLSRFVRQSFTPLVYHTSLITASEYEIENRGAEVARNLSDLGAYFSEDELEKVCSEHVCGRGTAILIAAREYIQNEEARKARLLYRAKEESAMESTEEVTKLSKPEPSLGGPEPTDEAPIDDDEVGTDSEYEYCYPEEGCMVGGEAVVDGEDVLSLG